MPAKKIIILVFITLSLRGSAQDYIKMLDSILNQEIDSKLKTVQIQNFLIHTGASQSPEINYKLSIHFYREKSLKKAIKYGEQTVLLRRKETPIDSLLLRKSISNLALYFYKNQNTEKAEKYCKQLISQKITDKYSGRAYYRLGNIYEDQGDYYKALEFYYSALNIYKKTKKSKDIVDTSFNIARVHTTVGDKKSIDKAIQLLEELKIIHNENLTSKNLQDLFLLLGNIYNHDVLENKEKSLENYFKALDIATIRDDKYYITLLHNNIGNIYLKHKIHKAKDYLIKGIKNSDTPTIEAMFLHNLGIYYFKIKEYNKAIEYVKQSIARYLDFDKTVDTHLIPFEEFQSSSNKNHILDALLFLVAYENQHLPSKEELTIIYNHIAIAEKLLDHIRFESDNQQSKLYWQEQASKLYQNAVKTAFLSKDPNKAFYFMEKNKAILLLQDITDKELKKNANLPEFVINREKKLKKEIYALQDKYSEATSLQKDSIAGIMNTRKIDFHRFIDSLRADYPEYYKYKKTPKVLSLEKVQAMLKEDEVNIEYSINKDSGFGLLIEKDKVDFFELKDVEKLNEDIGKFKSKIMSPFITSKDFDNYYTLSYQIYQTLFPFKNAEKYLSNKIITIVPDYSVQNFPFEALVINPKFTSDVNSYLIAVTEINYTYSISFLKENQQLLRNHTNDFGGFAPVHFNYNQLSNLTRSQKEIEEAEQQFSGTLFLDIEATKDSFKQHVSDSKIIHLSTHANATDSITPWIAFKKSKLTLNELYTTKNNAELVVLSACNSSLGELKPGEGVMSLARGFFYTGANSVIASLWNVDDKSGQYITSSFYKHLKKGKTKSEALRLAKLNYLENHSLSETSPYYWSSLVLIGDSGAIGVSSLSGYWWALLIGISVLIVLIFWARKKRN